MTVARLTSNDAIDCCMDAPSPLPDPRRCDPFRHDRGRPRHRITVSSQREGAKVTAVAARTEDNDEPTGNPPVHGVEISGLLFADGR